jgi:hypothetical protein
MSAREIEAFLARVYVDFDLRARFKANPFAEAKKAGLSDEECRTLENIDWAGLELATRSFARKRQLKKSKSWITSLKSSFARLFAVLSHPFRHTS